MPEKYSKISFYWGVPGIWLQFVGAGLIYSNCFLFPAAVAKEMPDISKVPQDLKTPAMEEGRAAPGKRLENGLRIP